MQKGKKFLHGDYALAGALKFAGSVPQVVHSYDMNCQYCRKIKAYLKACFPNLNISILKYVIPKWHTSTHRDECQFLHSLYYTPGVGNLDGEAPERNWSQLGPLSMSTREMNLAHRHKILEDHMNDINFSNLVAHGASADLLSYLMLVP
ncbi:hypothetical protein BOTBODRAFT_110556 [Botryobasidium botryosum FD-172 SS1]|uniref:Uncharacterized protein n=1 Tax=Botryobasidium botryosum (strain FD-172 SS1) TaxID=930990 RepID=A0A067MQD0_BOTB1|nr:hypothetical protein BOTBODRAFT_110556 [Botryobasidium botryosum FD-172 SS1]